MKSAVASTFAIAALLAPVANAVKCIPRPSPNSYINYTTITGFFMQDDPNTVPSTFNYATNNLGLINRTYETDATFDPTGKKPGWARFANYVTSLNANSPDNVQYKVLIMGRHGQGYHNVAESFYGTPAWNCYWSLIDGNGTVSWADAHVTPAGEAQTAIAHAFWVDALANNGLPAPESYYTSPLWRCLQTATLTFANLTLPDDRPFKVIVKEFMRESIGQHTCDRRSKKSQIHAAFPSYEFENGFTEDDLLYSPLRESDSAEFVRLKKLMDDIFTNDRGTFLSFTSHSGAIGVMLKVLGHRAFSLSTGASIPVLVRAEVINDKAPTVSVDPWAAAPTCGPDVVIPTTTTVASAAPTITVS
ncbi:histidine phosphatase superfamily [Cladochytrium replicatum]|nr:histidine phosphatase superfamily [Cladochytrium replicatum]